MSDILPLPWPKKGLSDERAFAEQPVDTCSEAVNVCAIDPRRGRVRGGSRCGTEKYVAGQVNGANRVVDLVSVERVHPRVTHAILTAGNEVTQWARPMPSKGVCPVVRLDDQGNVYAIDNYRTIVKKNSAGEEQWRIALPNTGDCDVVRALAIDIDTELGVLLFAGVSDSTQFEAQPRMWGYRQLADNKNELVWEMNPGGFVAHLAVRDGVLYAAVNNRETQTAQLKAWGSLGTANPVELWSKPIPFPANYNAVGRDGSTYVCAPANSLRNVNPLGRDVSKNLVDWLPTDLARAQARIWAWYSARNIDGSNNETLEDGDPITVWYDQSDNGRELVASLFGGVGAPRYIERGSTGFPSVSFDGTQGLQGQVGITTDALFANINKTFLPGHVGSGFMICMLVKVRSASPVVRQTLVEQGNHGGGAPPNIRIDMDSNQVPAAAAGFAVCVEPENAGTIGDAVGAGGNVSADGRWDRFYPYGAGDLTQGYAVLTRVFTNSWGVGVGAKSLWRSNGQPLDSWFPDAAVPMQWTAAAELGHGVDLPAFFRGEVMEILVLREEVFGGSKRVIESPDYPDSAWAVGNQGTEIERVEGYIAWNWGVSHLLPKGVAAAPSVAGGNDGNFPHGHYLTGGPPRTTGIATASRVAQLFDDGPLVAKLAPGGTGDIRWVVTNPTTVNNGLGGIGYACEPNEEQTVLWSVGPRSTTGVAAPSNDQVIQTNAVVRKIVDEGATERHDIGGPNPGPAAFVLGPVPGGPFQEFGYQYPKVDVFKLNTGPPANSSLGHLLVPLFESNLTEATLLLFLIGSTNQMFPHNTGTLVAVAPEGLACAIVQIPPATMLEQGVTIPETVYAGTRREKTALLTGTANVGAGDTVTIGATVYTFVVALGVAFDVLIGGTLAASLANLRDAINLGPTAGVDYHAATTRHPSVTATTATATTLLVAATLPESVGVVALAEASAVLSWGSTDLAFDDDTLHKVQLVSTTQIAGAPREVHTLAVSNGLIRRASGAVWTTPPGTATLDAAARFVQSADLAGKAYFTDGLSYREYDSRANLGGGQVNVWEATAGEMPKGAKLVTAWRGRVVLARTFDSPNGWFMSKLGAPRNFDYFPPELSADMAVAGSLSDVGLCPDVVNTMIPLSDDLLLFGGAGSIWLMRGDPAAGGQFDLLTDETGLAFGRPWCKDPYGATWALGSRGGLFRIGPDGSYTRVSEHRIDRRLSSIDFANFHARLVWDEDGRCVHVFLVPFGAPSAIRHFRYEVTVDAFWEQEYPIGQEITSVLLAEGDLEADRVVLLGCADGFVRRIARNARSDDGSPIWSRVRIGPITPPGSPLEVRFSRLQVALADDEDGALVEAQISDRADAPGPLFEVGELEPGLSDTLPLRQKGAYVWLTITSAKAGTRWSYETAMVRYRAAGRKRVRRPVQGA